MEYQLWGLAGAVVVMVLAGVVEVLAARRAPKPMDRDAEVH